MRHGSLVVRSRKLTVQPGSADFRRALTANSGYVRADNAAWFARRSPCTADDAASCPGGSFVNWQSVQLIS
jgi:hypothetical protein